MRTLRTRKKVNEKRKISFKLKNKTLHKNVATYKIKKRSINCLKQKKKVH